MEKCNLEEKVQVYEHVLHQIQMYREVVMSHEKVVELLDVIGAWSYAHRCGNGELTDEEQQAGIDYQFHRLKQFPNVVVKMCRFVDNDQIS